jgi:hypothetical protein
MVLAVVWSSTWWPAVHAASDTTVTPEGGGGIIPLPNSGVKPQASGDRGGSAQLALFALLLVAMAFILVRIVRGANATQRARESAAQQVPAERDGR